MKIPPKISPINNFVLKLGAIVFALFLWFYVSAQQNPFMTQTVEVPVNYQNLEDGLSLSNAPQAINIKISGRKEAIGSLRSGDFKASVDMSQVVIGDNELAVQVAGPGAVDIVNVSPQKVKLYVDRMTEINLEVQASVSGKVAAGYTEFTPVITPTSVKVKGAESILNTIKTARVEVDLTEASGNLVLNLPVKLLTKDGTIVDPKSLDILPQNVEVFLPVDETPAKSVAVKPILIGNPAEGFVISKVVTEPAAVAIAGGADKVNAINQLQTMPIYVSNITDDVVQEVELKVPDGVTLLDSNKIKVRISVIAGTMSKEVELPLTVQNNEEQLTATPAQTTVKVTFEGTEADVNDQTKIDSILPYLDVAGLAAGSHTVEIKLNNSSGLNVVQVQPASIQVEIVATDKTMP